MLQTVHERCLVWARRHGASFASEKYIPVHFTKARTKHNHSSPLTLPTSTIDPSSSARVLDVILHKKLSSQPYLQHIKSKLGTETNILSRLTASTWVPPYGFQGFSTLLLYAQPSPPAAVPSGTPLPHHFFELRWGKSSRELRTVVSELSLGPTRPHQYEASRQKWASPLCLSTWMAGRPTFA